jgi:hypothetical protein
MTAFSDSPGGAAMATRHFTLIGGDLAAGEAA